MNKHVLDKHQETIEDKITGVMDIWNNPGKDVFALCRNVKYYMVTINHHSQSIKHGFHDIALFSDGGWSEGD